MRSLANHGCSSSTAPARRGHSKVKAAKKIHAPSERRRKNHLPAAGGTKERLSRLRCSHRLRALLARAPREAIRRECNSLQS